MEAFFFFFLPPEKRTNIYVFIHSDFFSLTNLSLFISHNFDLWYFIKLELRDINRIVRYKLPLLIKKNKIKKIIRIVRYLQFQEVGIVRYKLAIRSFFFLSFLFYRKLWKCKHRIVREKSELRRQKKNKKQKTIARLKKSQLLFSHGLKTKKIKTSIDTYSRLDINHFMSFFG